MNHNNRRKRTVGMAYTTGNEQDFLRWSEFRFKNNINDRRQK